MKKIKKNKGITLVALVITIVVLLILAGISINLVLGENGIISKAKEAKAMSGETSEKEKQDMDNFAQEIDDKLEEKNSDDDETQVPVEPTVETAPYFPNSTFKKVAGTLDTGLVIADANGNEYVWIEVPRSNSVYKDIELGKTTFTSEDYTNIEEDLQTYAATYRSGISSLDTWAADSNDGWLNSEKYTELKQKMLRSIYTNGGFYVGRYETGIDPEKEQARYFDISDTTVYTTLHATEQKPVIKANAYPYTWVRRTQAQKLAESFNYVEGEKQYTGSLLFGIQWDLVLKFMSEHDQAGTDSALTGESGDIGNYYSSTDNLKDGARYAVFSNKVLSSEWKLGTVSTENYVKNKRKYSFSSYGNGVLLTTGSTLQTVLANIYDIAGNVEELTIENSTDANKPCISRGGNFSTSGKSAPANYRNKRSVNESSYDVGFRVALF